MKKSAIVYRILVILTVMFAVMHHFINILLVTHGLPLISLFDVVIMITVVALLYVDKSFENRLQVFFWKILSIISVFAVHKYTLMSFYNSWQGSIYDIFGLYLIILFTVYFLLSVYFTPIALLHLAFEKANTKNSNLFWFKAITMLFVIVLPACCGYNQMWSDWFYPNRIQTITNEAIQYKSTDYCNRINKLHFTELYNKIEFNSYYNYHYPVVSERVCRNTVLAISNRDIGYCNHNLHAKDKMGNATLGKLDRIIIAGTCINNYLNLYPSAHIELFNINDYQSIGYEKEFLSITMSPSECDSGMKSFDYYVNGNDKGYIQSPSSKRNNFIVGSILHASCVKHNGFSNIDAACVQYDVYLLGKSKIGRLKWKSFLTNDIPCIDGAKQKAAYPITCAIPIGSIDKKGVFNEETATAHSRSIDNPIKSCSNINWEDRMKLIGSFMNKSK